METKYRGSDGRPSRLSLLVRETNEMETKSRKKIFHDHADRSPYSLGKLMKWKLTLEIIVINLTQVPTR